jgi:3-hydroxymyristoyl/3-hydroxydecanoyl-(acyl carrier protein) dehydratase
MNFLFVDRILKLEPDQYIAGVKYITPDIGYLQQDAEGQTHVMPEVIGEALGQLGAWNVMQQNAFTRRPVAGVVGSVEFLGHAYVGDTVLLETFIDQHDEQAVHYHSVASVNGQPIFKINNALGPCLPMEEFIDSTEVRQQFAQIHRPDDIASVISAATQEAKLVSKIEPAQFIQVGFDKILSWETGGNVVAMKHVSLHAPYFVDHFPRKPVLPLTLLIHCKTQLAREYIVDLLGTEKADKFYLANLRKIKMNQFIQPGDSIQTTLMPVKIEDEMILLRFRTELAGKRVCISELIFLPK